jgi:hypothetical protein
MQNLALQVRQRDFVVVDDADFADAGRRKKGKCLVIANGAEAEVNAGLVELIKDAFTIRIQLLSGSDDSIEAMSGRLGMNKCRLSSLIRLSYLAPDIVRALLEGSADRAHADATLATEQGPATRQERTATCSWLRRLNLHQNPGETLPIRRLENGLGRPCGRSRPTPWRFASLVGTDAFAGALTRGSIGTIPETAETENTRKACTLYASLLADEKRERNCGVLDKR